MANSKWTVGGGTFAAILAATMTILMLTKVAAAQGGVCQEGLYPIYTAEGTLASCEENIGAPPGSPGGVSGLEGCPDGQDPGYLGSGQLAGCFGHGEFTWEEVCNPDEADADSDGLGDPCDPCPTEADCDGDGYLDGAEVYIGTDPLDSCPDDTEDDAWPPDINNDGLVDIFDVLKFKPHLGCSLGDDCYRNRNDLNTSGQIDIFDVLMIKPSLKAGMGACDQVGPAGSSGTWPSPNPPYYQTTLHHYAVRQWCWWPPFLSMICLDKYWMHLGQVFYWSPGFNTVLGGTHTLEAGAVEPFHVISDFLYMLYQPWPDAIRATAETIVYLVPADPIYSTFPVKIWLWCHGDGSHSAGHSGF